MKHLLIAAGLLTATSAMAAEKPQLTVYTYDSFVSDWGPGPKAEEAFEAVCNCDLKLVGVEDGAALLSRIRLEGENSEADIVLGLDTNLIETAKKTGLFTPHAVEADYTLPIEWADDTFVPYDWGYFAFVHKAGVDAPSSFRELADSDRKILIQDPRSSTPGLGLLLWIKSAYGDEANDIWADLSDNIVTVTKGWSEAYGLFLDGEADMVLSYTTSPAYHLIAEEDDSKTTATFDEGHYMQIEVAAKLAGTNQSELADQFLNFMVSDAFQTIIPTTNWMYPSVTPVGGLPEGFNSLKVPAKALFFSPEEAVSARSEALPEWLEALSQ
ncbi:Thiamine-binding periplasmic protein precursor [Pseudovibrio axinellae]|uniref:Thiamine-binding periplasmic protein n=1 Tax=Pseudovibrio axinellae TaxID=989403 RepID=A0A165ZSN9_9HYPH|nr:thiamine ABC transporter substrate binding subunit [Pseudovibrio axinellae]KZL20233.1 Thiamine-binding periplasmic protein precursor [Pseudovibrio axinellae]SEQ62021.1 thiamine transport system substrate-binding protein [Pseudovibrio axinellae]